MNPWNVKSIALTGLVLITATLSGCASFNSELQCPFKRGVSCRSLSDVNAAVSRGEFDALLTSKRKTESFKNTTEKKIERKLVSNPIDFKTRIKAKTKYHPSNTVIDLNDRVIETVNHHTISLDRQPSTLVKTLSSKKPHRKHHYTLRELRRLNEIQYSLQIEPEEEDASTTALSNDDLNVRDNRVNAKNASLPSPDKNSKKGLKPISLTKLSAPIDENDNLNNNVSHSNQSSDKDGEHESHSQSIDNESTPPPEHPKRTQEHISMIYIAPYVDENGDYHAMQTIYHVDKPSEWE